ncbi:VOC family protein [Kitasatospora cheerisanensis]|uniref:Cysteine transferase n=1 Tax=Kitasatospora cheerisanensis KCTC 2395 TaxID=1348663 RepID=A0A066YWI9_9ACTN|nr:VOC family protein [Kitasatospora cheerisanensis]KDN84339.1 cysteine transferase [Kitasatospora cheerisanensis KCTC 2395]
MPVELNHTIVAAKDRQATAAFLTELLGLPEAEVHEPFLAVQLGNRVTLDVMTAPGPITPQHYAFLVSEDEFDAVLGRITAGGLPHWADPFFQQPGRINHWNGGRGVYVKDPDGHSIEALTRP